MKNKNARNQSILRPCSILNCWILQNPDDLKQWVKIQRFPEWVEMCLVILAGSSPENPFRLTCQWLGQEQFWTRCMGSEKTQHREGSRFSLCAFHIWRQSKMTPRQNCACMISKCLTPTNPRWENIHHLATDFPMQSLPFPGWFLTKITLLTELNCVWLNHLTHE